ncbi:MAG: DUF4293 domain-containing protein [Bacteroidetes bacterium]|nr:DUF4293 domain-containing protein [Bacteroidota bacterium]
MIQRIQTLFLIGVAAISIMLFFFPFSEKVVPDPPSATEIKLVLKVDKIVMEKAGVVETVEANYPLMVLNILILIAALFIIFQYKNRIAQIRLCMFTTLLTTVMLVVIFYFSERMGKADIKAHYLEGVYLVAVQVFLILAARKFIRKDEMMVRAADRIR